MRPLMALLATGQLNRGTYATSSSHTANPRKFSKDKGIDALDGAAL